MSKAIGEVTRIDGEYIVKSGDGSLKILAPGTLLFEDDVIQGRGGSRELEIELVNGDKLVLGGDEVVTLSESVISKEPFDAQDTQIEPEQIVSKVDSSDWTMSIDPEMIIGSIEPEHFVARAFLDHDILDLNNGPAFNTNGAAFNDGLIGLTPENEVTADVDAVEAAVETVESTDVLEAPAAETIVDAAAAQAAAEQAAAQAAAEQAAAQAAAEQAAAQAAAEQAAAQAAADQ
ncbi:MAG: hypothetical protein Q8O20_11935, partial [Sulfuricurvum sp.]|uniref:hypothetical protein n=1 Tax=Sulfuricurvum sp. TaxID=2025608 RepID=UPI0027323D2C